MKYEWSETLDGMILEMESQNDIDNILLAKLPKKVWICRKGREYRIGGYRAHCSIQFKPFEEQDNPTTAREGVK